MVAPTWRRAGSRRSHQNILWVAKDDRRYRFNYRLCKRSHYDDWLSKRNQQLRDVWDIPANGHENKAYRHPSPKPLAVLAKILDVAGKPGGLLLDLFSGSGTGAVAASDWGMRSVSIEREASYVQMIRQRVAARGVTKLAHSAAYSKRQAIPSAAYPRGGNHHGPNEEQFRRSQSGTPRRLARLSAPLSRRRATAAARTIRYS